MTIRLFIFWLRIIISIHTAFAGCDFWYDAVKHQHHIFQSTQPSQAVTFRSEITRSLWTFQSTQPSQAVTMIARNIINGRIFQSTQPSQAVTKDLPIRATENGISIHTAFAGCDSIYPISFPACSIFQSTQPSQAVTCISFSRLVRWVFQSTQPSQAVT